MISNESTQLSVAHRIREGTPRSRPKLLFLAYFFPPSRAVACVRAWNIAKHLTRLGWDVTVVTPDPFILKNVENPDETAIKLSREGIRRILTDHQLRFLMGGYVKCRDTGLGWFLGGIGRRIARYLDIDRGIGWVKTGAQACSNLTEKDVDVILATGPPFAPFRLAKLLSVRLGRPYVLDYRDPWTQNPHQVNKNRESTVKVEGRLLKDAAAVTIVSRSWGVALGRRFNLGPKLHIITNGYDPEEFECIEPHDFGHFAIVYAGTFYPPKRVISPLMATLQRLKRNLNGKEWYFHYFGGHEDHVLEEATRFEVMERVITYGSVQRTDVLSAIKGAGVTVVITSVVEDASLGDKGIMTGKVFEPIGLGTPVLLIAPSGSDVECLAESTGLARYYSGGDIEGMYSYLSALIKGSVTIEPTNLESYSWLNIANRLSSVLLSASVNAFRAKNEIPS